MIVIATSYNHSLKISSRLKFFLLREKKAVKTVTDWIINTAAGGEGSRGGKWGESNVNQQPDSVIPTLNRWREKKHFLYKIFHKSQSTSPAEE